MSAFFTSLLRIRFAIPVFQAVLLVWVYYLYRSHALQPSHWPITLLIAGIVFGSVLQAGYFLAACWHRRNRARELRLLALILLPSLGLLWGGLYTHRITSNRIIPDNLLTRWMASAGICLSDLELSIRYPVRYEGERCTMYCAEPREDASTLVDEMDAHIHDMEAKLERKGTTKARWVRGTILGRNNFQFFGFAMSDYPPKGAESPAGIQILDRHELAHFAVSQFLQSDSSPPFVLVEGWAQAMSLSREQLAIDAWRMRFSTQEPWRLKELTTPPWSRLDRGPVYYIGGAFVDYLIRRFGAPKFLELYVSTNDEVFARQFEKVYGVSLESIEPDFWLEVEQRVPKADKKGNQWIDPDSFSKEAGKDLWVDFVETVNDRTGKQSPVELNRVVHFKVALERGNGGPSETPTKYHRVEDVWQRGEKAWCRVREFTDDKQAVGEEAFYADTKSGFGFLRSGKGASWKPHPNYDSLSPEDAVGLFRQRAITITRECDLDEFARSYFNHYAMKQFQVVDVHAESSDTDQILEITIENRNSEGIGLKRGVCRFSRNWDWQVQSASLRFKEENGKDAIAESKYEWSKNGDDVQLKGYTRTLRDQDDKLLSTSECRWDVEAFPPDTAEPFQRSDFPQSRFSSVGIPQVNKDTIALIAACLDLMVVLGTTFWIARTHRTN